MLGHLLQLVWLMLPAYGANMAPPLLRYWRGWNRPICARWFGSHKTIIGFVLGVMAAIAVTALQRVIHAPFALLDGTQWLRLGCMFGTGAMLGDLIKSFVKRRLGITPGARWLPFDQIDFALGALIAITPWITLPLRDVVAILVITFAGDLATNRIAFRFGIKQTPW